jgi:tetratricopeptide (TPR) repeat protein
MEGTGLSGNGEIYLRLATRSAQEGGNLQALEYIDKVIVTNPKCSMAWQVKGNCLNELGRHREAVECYDTAIRLNPCDSESWFNKGLSLLELGQEAEANECITRAVNLALG